MAKKNTKKTIEKITESTESVAERINFKAFESTVETPAAQGKTKAAKTAYEPVIKCTIEFQGVNTTVNSIVDNIIKTENKKNIKTLDIYIQPENRIAYYVVNGKEEGKSVNLIE